VNTETSVENKTLQYNKGAVLELSRNLLWQSVVNLIPHADFQPTIEWVRSKLPSLSFEEAGSTIEALRLEGFLNKSFDGKWLEVNINFQDYLGRPEILESQFIISNEVASLIQESRRPYVYQTFVLSSESAYVKWANAVHSATVEFRKTSEEMNGNERTILYALAINGADVSQLKKGSN
jgi:hypothetical protein